jgi:hypothetical protein
MRPDFSGLQLAALPVRYGAIWEPDYQLSLRFTALMKKVLFGEPERDAWKAITAWAITDSAYAAERASELTDSAERDFMASFGIPADEYLHWTDEIIRASVQKRATEFEVIVPRELQGPAV